MHNIVQFYNQIITSKVALRMRIVCGIVSSSRSSVGLTEIITDITRSHHLQQEIVQIMIFYQQQQFYHQQQLYLVLRFTMIANRYFKSFRQILDLYFHKFVEDNICMLSKCSNILIFQEIILPKQGARGRKDVLGQRYSRFSFSIFLKINI